jgi:hypothetical protein
MRKISATQEFKIKTTKELDYTKLLLERKARKEMIARHGALWFILWELFVLDDCYSIEEFKRTFLFVVFIGLPIFLLSAYSFLTIISILGVINNG